MLRRLLIPVLLMVVVAACGGQSSTSAPATAAPTTAPTTAPVAKAPTSAPTTAAAAVPKANPTTAPTTAATAVPKVNPTAAATTAPVAPTAAPKATGSASAPAASSAPLKLNIVADGTEARFMVKEQLAQRNLPNDAVGTTKNVTGSLVIDQSGKVAKDQSKFTVQISSLKTDQSMRDGFIHRSVLESDKYPNADFVPTEVKGLPSPLPTSGDVNFQIVGDMTMRGVTKPVTWDVTGKIDGKTLTGKATTRLKFADFNMTQPRVPVVLSIEDDIRLELDFKLAAQA